MKTALGNAPTQRRFADEIISEDMAAVMRGKTPADRLAAAFGMWRFARQLIEQTTRQQHPDWSDREIQAFVARRMSHGTV